MKVDGHFKYAPPLSGDMPSAQLDSAVFQGHAPPSIPPREKTLGAPGDGLLRLRAILRKPLRKVSFAIQKRYRHHRQANIRSRSNGVARQDAETATVAGHGVLQRNLHGKIGNKPLG